MTLNELIKDSETLLNKYKNDKINNDNEIFNCIVELNIKINKLINDVTTLSNDVELLKSQINNE